MFGRIVEFTPKPEMKDEIVNVLRNEVLPILRKQQGFVEFLPFVPEAKTGKWITVTLWAEKRDEERWEREGYPKVDGILKFYLVAPPISNHFDVETSLCQRQLFENGSPHLRRGTPETNNPNPSEVGCELESSDVLLVVPPENPPSGL
jgi:heme-degrading monooxygenase HmoA